MKYIKFFKYNKNSKIFVKNLSNIKKDILNEI